MNVLFFTLDYHPGLAGGAERQARLQAEELLRRGHRVSVVCPRSAGQSSTDVADVRVSRLPRIRHRRLRKLSYALVLGCWVLVHGRRFDVWHVHLASRQADFVVVLGLLMRRPTYVKIASAGETGEVQEGTRSAWLTRRVGLRRASRVQALSGEIEGELRAVGVAPDRIVRIPNGLDLSVFAPADARRRHAIRGELGLPRDRRIVLYTGRFAEYKGVGDLLRAWESIAEGLDGLLLLVGARGAEDRPLSVPARGPGVMTRPWTTAIVDYLHAADVFVYPAHQDGMSNALLEAMACGLAPLATDIPAVRDLLEHEQNALLVPPVAPSELSRELLRFLADDELRAAVARAAARTARDYSIEGVVDQIELTYRDLVPC
ncbi:MAG: glycosyltransferase family 4 protein [Solirubrobacterales bacterium]|nr:glycosyltransferase family 4 protein [Solirubrobacterales bacterium]